MTTLLDTGPLVAILNARDAHHDWAVECAGQLDAPFLTCEAVFSEAHFLLEDPPNGQSRLLELMVSDRIDAPFSYADHARRVNHLMRTYSDLPMSFADDSDFRVYQKHGDQPIPALMP